MTKINQIINKFRKYYKILINNSNKFKLINKILMFY